MNDDTSKLQKTLWVIAGALAVIALVAVIGLFYPRPVGTNVAGTIGGVQKAERYRAEQVLPSAPMWNKDGNLFFRRDPDTKRPRSNKEGSRLDKEQKSGGEYYYAG